MDLDIKIDQFIYNLRC